MFILLTAFCGNAIGQGDIPVGTWRHHISFNNLDHIIATPDRIVGANRVGLLVFDRVDSELFTITKIDGLSSAPISALGFSNETEKTIVGHENGLITIIKDDIIEEINSLVIAPSITGSKKINHVFTLGPNAYLAADFGLVVFNLNDNQVIETYRDLSSSGNLLTIRESLILQDTLWLASEAGVLGGPLNGSVNLLDFRNWKRYDNGSFNSPVESLAGIGDVLHAAIDFDGIYQLNNGDWSSLGVLPAADFNDIKSNGDKLIITTRNEVWTLTNGTLNQEGVGAVSNPDEALEADGLLWVADGTFGMLSISGNDNVVYNTKAPSQNFPWKVISSSNEIFVTGGGFSNGIPLQRPGSVDRFFGTHWNRVTSALSQDIVDFEQIGPDFFLASFGGGLEKISDGVSTIYDPSNSPLVYNSPVDNDVLLSAIEVSSGKVWVVNYGASVPLHSLSSDGNWQSYNVEILSASFTTDLAVDQLGHVWMVVDPAKGGGIVVFDPASQKTRLLTSTSGKGALPSSNVLSVAVDRDGQVWVGTAEGVAYFANPANIFNTEEATRPIFENRFLLRDEQITSIAVDGGNRKWLATTNGVWLFSPNGEELIHNFNEENSLLPSNEVAALAIDNSNGEVFFATNNGLVSFRADATSGQLSFDNVRIFPNPVDPAFVGVVSIDGLYTDAVVKITDLGGRLVWQTRANGGTATWDPRGPNGNRVSTGMYLVFATSEDGSERHVGKIAVIE